MYAWTHRIMLNKIIILLMIHLQLPTHTHTHTHTPTHGKRTTWLGIGWNKNSSNGIAQSRCYSTSHKTTVNLTIWSGETFKNMRERLVQITNCVLPKLTLKITQRKKEGPILDAMTGAQCKSLVNDLICKVPWTISIT